MRIIFFASFENPSLQKAKAGEASIFRVVIAIGEANVARVLRANPLVRP
jgi:hypothetical protein